MKLDVLTLEQCELVRRWRNECLETLRTPYPLTQEQQERFYRERVCNSDSPHRYWAVIFQTYEAKSRGQDVWEFIGMGGLTHIQWENRLAEISLILDPEQRGKGLGEQAVDLLLEQAFDRMGLKTVCGEVYACNTEAWAFWRSVSSKHDDIWEELPNRKFWAGKFWDSAYFSIDGDVWRQVKHGIS